MTSSNKNKRIAKTLNDLSEKVLTTDDKYGFKLIEEMHSLVGLMNQEQCISMLRFINERYTMQIIIPHGPKFHGCYDIGEINGNGLGLDVWLKDHELDDGKYLIEVDEKEAVDSYNKKFGKEESVEVKKEQAPVKKETLPKVIAKKVVPKKEVAPEPESDGDDVEVEYDDEDGGEEDDGEEDAELEVEELEPVAHAQTISATVTISPTASLPVVRVVNAVKADKPAKKIQRALNKMEFFKMQFRKDPEVFEEYLPAKVRNSIKHKYRDELDGYCEDHAYDFKVQKYYEYMRDKHDSELQRLKNEYVENLAAQHE